VQVGGLVQNPKTYAIEDLLKFQQKERIYRLRCVEAWSMVIPWAGFELSDLLNEVQPMASAKYVAFTTLMDTAQMPGEGDPSYPWPYKEGLRLDEAMHRLTILATGMYGHDLPNQDGAPLRLVVPWKYGFKSIKAIVKIELTDKQPEPSGTTLPLTNMVSTRMSTRMSTTRAGRKPQNGGSASLTASPHSCSMAILMKWHPSIQA